MSFLRRFLFIAYILIYSSNGYAQSAIDSTMKAIYSKKLYTVEDGLTQGYITSLFEDHNGYLWIGTLNGLNRFDGKTFENFTENPNDSFSVKGQYVDQILEDHLGRVWVLFNNGTISVFDEKEKRFHSLHLSGYIESQERNFVQLTFHNEEIWLLQINSICRIKLVDQKKENANWNAEVSYVTVIDEYQKEPRRLRDLVFDQHGHLWLSSIHNVLIIDEPYSNSDTLISRTLQLPDAGGPMDHFDLLRMNRDSLWLSNWQGDLFLLKGELVLHHNRYSQRGKHLGISALKKDANGINWLQHVGTATLYDQKSRLFYELDFISTCLYQSKDGTIWSGTDGFGLYRFSPKNSPFVNIGNDGYGIEAGHEMYAGALTKSRNDELLMLKGEVIKLEEKTGQWVNHVRWVQELLKEPETIDARAYLEDSKGRNWLATNGSIYCKERDGSTSIYSGESTKNGMNPFNGIVGIIEDNEQKIWVIKPRLLQAFDEETKSFERYSYQIENPPPREDGLNSYFDHPEKLWLATEMGLYLFDKKNSEVKRKWIEINGKKLENVAFSALHQDKDDTTKIWVGTKNKGLFIYDLKKDSWSVLSQKNGLTNNTIYAIAQDELSRIWVSTNSGIFCFTPDENNWVNFRKRNGIQGDEFNTRSFAQIDDGRIFFGGMNGVTAFHPLAIQKQPKNHPIVLNRFAYEEQIDDTTKVQLIEDWTSAAKLSFSQSRRIEIEFAWLNYDQPENHSYAYRLSEREQWIDIGYQNKLSFYNLNPGEYKLEVKATDWMGNINQSSLAIPFTISAPWYKTGWAYLTYLLLSIGLLTLLFRIREKRKRLEVEAVFNRNEAERFKDLEQTKSHFFSNITHEFKTPLTLVIGPLEQLYERSKTKADKNLIHTAKRNAADLLDLVNQLLNLNKMEQGKMPVNYSKGDIAAFVAEICSKSKHLADSKHIELTFNSSPEAIDTSFDSRKVERIVINLLSNALKFSRENTIVRVSLNRVEDSVILKVQDQGPGIPEDKLETVFEQFYQIDDSEKRKQGGTGIGLALVKEYAKILGASVNVRNNVDGGCTFQVVFPIVHSDRATELVNDDVLGLENQVNPLLEPTASAISNDGNPIVLIAEDNVELNDYLKSCLTNYSVIQAFDGEQAWQLAQEHLPDLILTDYMMPEVTGVELCAKVKDFDLTSHIPVIILTAKSSIESRVEGLSFGADDYLSKPFNQRELLVRIDNLIGLRKALREKFESSMQSVKLSKSGQVLSAKDKAFVEKAEAIIEANLDNGAFEVSDFNEAMNLSRSQAHRKIKALTNVSVSVFIRSYRLKRAMEMIINEGVIVKEAAYRVGFNSPSYFSKCFHDQFGIPPTQLMR